MNNYQSNFSYLKKSTFARFYAMGVLFVGYASGLVPAGIAIPRAGFFGWVDYKEKLFDNYLYLT
jgi:hypothetical protein